MRSAGPCRGQCRDAALLRAEPPKPRALVEVSESAAVFRLAGRACCRPPVPAVSLGHRGILVLSSCYLWLEYQGFRRLEPFMEAHAGF